MTISFPKFEKFSSIFLLNIFSMLLACTSSSVPVIHRFGLLMVPVASVHTFLFFSLSLSEYSNSSILYLSPDILSTGETFN
jgi:hypothetical protein